MALKGDLASVGLADVFQMLAHNQKVGILSIHGKDAWSALYFDRRGVTLYYNEHSFLDRLLDTLVRRNYVAADTLDGLRRQSTGEPIATVEALLSGGLLQEELFLESFRSQMEEEIYDLFLWEKVHWEFLEGENAITGQDGVVNENFFFGADSLIMEAARRLDEWVFIREQVPGPTEVFETISGYSAHEVVGLDELTLSVLDFVDGKRDVSRIVEISQMTAFQVNKSLSVLAQKSFIQPLPYEKLISNANECIAEARLDDGIRLLERAVQVGAGLPDAYLLAAKTYEMQGEAASAVWHYKRYAIDRIEYGAIDDGVEVLEQTIALIPTDLEAWERLVHGLMLQASPRLDPHAVGKDLIDLYLELDETDRARRVLEDLLKARPHDIELKKSLIAVHTKAGDTRRVMDLYESIADDLVVQKDPIGAVRYLQKILMIDRNRREISDRIKQLYVMDEKHRSRRRSFAILLAGLLCCGTLGTIYYLYERNVRKAFEEIDVGPFIQESRFEEAIAVYKKFLSDYPLNFVQGDVQKEIEKIKGMASLREAKRLAEQRKKAAESRKKRAEYRQLWREYEKSISEKLDMDGALSRLKSIKSLAALAGEAEDRKFLVDHNIDEAIRTTRDYIGNAGQLATKVEEALRKGRIVEARANALRLHNEFPYTPATQGCPVPFEIQTDPPGARIYIDDKLWTSKTGTVLTTPVTVRLPFDRQARIKITRVGFEDLFVKLAGADPSPLSLLLRVKPEAVIKLESDAVTGVGAGESVGLVGVRGGRIVGFDLATGKQSFAQRLGGLDEVQGTPVVRDKVGYFATTLGRIYSISLDTGKEGWRVKVPGGVKSSLVAVPRGLVVVNGKGDILCYDERDGGELWRYKTGAPPNTNPLWDGDRLWYANRDGLLMALDVEDTERAAVHRRDVAGALTAPVRVGQHLAVLSADGKVHVYETRRTARESAAVRFDEPGSEAWLLPDPLGVVVVTRDGYVRRMDPRNEKKPLLRARRLPREVILPPLATSDALFFVSRGRKGEIHVTSINSKDLSTRWDYVLEGGIRGQPMLKGKVLFVAGAGGKVHVLK